MLQLILDPLISLRDILSEHPMFATGILLVAGYVFGKIVAMIKLPEITGFIIAGLLMGEHISGIFPAHMNDSFKIITEAALGLIALTIGAEFSFGKLRRTGKGVLIITLMQLILTFIAVAAGLRFFGLRLPFALLLGAIATATAPAATVAIVQSLRARGLFVDYLYGVVALDDAGCVIIFGMTFAFVSGILQVDAEATNSAIFVFHAILEVVFSLLIGAAGGFLLHWIVRKMKNSNEILIISLGVIFMSTAVSIVFHLSPLLTNMASGAALINLSARNHRIFRILEPLTPPLYALFFVIAGAELNPFVVAQREVLILGSLYILLRGLGKYIGVWIGSAAVRTSVPIRDNLGLCMLPQAGVAIGLVLFVEASPITAKLGPEGLAAVTTMINIVLLSVFVNELIGPPLSKMGIIKGNQMEE